MDRKQNKTILRNKKGSTLIWVLLLMLVLAILIAAGLAIAQAYANKSITQHYDKQSYYTAYSATKAMADWLQDTTITTETVDGTTTTEFGTGEPSDQQKFVEQLKAAGTLTKGVNFGSSDMGTCTTTFKMNDKGDISISSKASYEGQDSVVSVTLKNTPTEEFFPGGPTSGPGFPSYTIPDEKGLEPLTIKNNQSKYNGQYKIANDVGAGSNEDFKGYFLIPQGRSFSFNSGNHEIVNAADNKLVLNIWGTFNLYNPNTRIIGDTLINGGTLNVNSSGISFTGDILMNGGNANVDNNTRITGNVYVQNGAQITFNGAATIDGNVYIYDGGSCTFHDAAKVTGCIIVYNSQRQCFLTINNSAFTVNEGLYLMAPKGGDAVPQIRIYMSSTPYTKFVHVQSLNIFKYNSPDGIQFPDAAYCTGHPNGECKDVVPKMPGGTTTGDGGSDKTVTTYKWSIGSYTGTDIAK